jgi:two-component system, cell cycle sensor histidine kinase and response regulator CckA
MFNSERPTNPEQSETPSGIDCLPPTAGGKAALGQPIQEKQIRSDRSLRDSEARYRRLFESAQDGILILDAETGMITDVNPFLIKLLGYSHAEFLKMALWDIGLFKDVEASKSVFRELQTRQYVRYENLPLKTTYGQSISVEFVSNVYEVNGKDVIQCNIRDISQRNIIEQRGQRLRQGQKMEAVGQLAGGVAHDFNNLLGVILGYCEILEEQSDLSESSRMMIKTIHNSGISAKNLTQRLLAFSRRQVLQPVFLDLNASVQGMEAMLSRLIGDNVTLVSALRADLGTIKADPSQLEQVLMNLVINARDAMPKGGKIVIETENIDVDESYAWEHPSITPGKYITLKVSDTGSGMDMETQTHIFEPFFSTKAPGQGTGLGLSTVFGIVRQSGGMIAVDSELGIGTTFEITFPRCDEAAFVSQAGKENTLCGGTETILLVDDAADLRKLIRLILEDCGYTVLDSGDPEEAFRLAVEHEGTLSLMITDMVMPGFSGSVLAERLELRRKETKVLYMSGYAEDAMVNRRVQGRDYAFIEKPFTRQDLIRKVRELLDAPVAIA